MTIVNDDSRVVNKLENLLTDNPRVVKKSFIVQAPAVTKIKNVNLKHLLVAKVIWVN
jgi:hypothetical protein